MWYVFYSSHPLKAANQLRNDGLQAVVHMTHEWKRAHRKVKARKPSRVPVPAYGGYFFLCLPDEQAHNVLRLCKARVRAIAVDGQEPRPIRNPSIVVDPPVGLFHDTDIPRYRVDYTEPPAFNVGARVQFSWSGLDGLKSEVMQVKGSKLKVALGMLGAEFVDVPVEAVVRAA